MFDDDDDSRPSGEPPAERPLTIPATVLWWFVATTLLFVLASVTVAIRESAKTDLVSATACVAAAYLITIYIIGRVHANQRSISSMLALRPTNWLLYPLAAFVGAALHFPASLLQHVIEKKWPLPEAAILDQIATYRMDSSARRILVPVLVVCIGPLIEELLYRGALQTGLRKTQPPSVIIPSLAMLFALAHVEPRLMPVTFLVGLVLCALRAASGSLIPALIAHMCFNAVEMIQILMGASASSTPLAPMRWIAGAGLMGVAALVLSLWVAFQSEDAARARQEDLE